MNNTVKFVINDRESLSELLKDPEVEIRIKDAIVDGVGKRAAKAAQSVLEKSLNSAVKSAIGDFCADLKSGEWFEKDKYGWSDSVHLTEKAKKCIASQIEDVLDEESRRLISDGLEEKTRAKIDEILELKIAEAKDLDVKAMVQKAVDRYVERKLGAGWR